MKVEQNREYNAIYWTFIDFPTWYISREAGWIAFAYIPSTDVKHGLYTWSVVMRKVLRTFHDLEGWDFERTGVRISIPGASRVIKAQFKVFLADAKALAEFLSLKGSSGKKPCCECKNVIGRCEFFDDGPYFLHTSTAKTVFDEHTPESFQDLVDDLKALHAAGRVGELNRREMTYGIKFEEDGLIFDPWTSRIANVPDSVYFDTHHNMLASGGFAQYEINQSARKILQLNLPQKITLADLDTWRRNIKTPKQGVTKLSGKWFQNELSTRTGHTVEDMPARS